MRVGSSRAVLQQVGLADSTDAFFAFVDSRWTFGDTAHTLVRPTDFLDARSEFLTEYDETLGVLWRPVLHMRFWT